MASIRLLLFIKKNHKPFWQNSPLSVFAHVQLNEPSVFVHVEFLWQAVIPRLHSCTSDKKKPYHTYIE